MKLTSLALRCAAALGLVGAANLVHAQTVLTVSTWVPPAHILSQTQAKWCEALASESAGKMRCNILPRGVAPPAGTYDAVRNGLADVSFTVHGYTPNRFLFTQMAELPFLGNFAEPISLAFQRTVNKHPTLLSEHQGVRVLGVFVHGPGIVFNTKRAIAKVEDTQGLKFRVGGGMVNEIAKSLGMNVTLKPATEAFELLSTGVMDGTFFTAESIESFKIDKIIKHATLFPGGLYNTSFVFMMNPDRYAKLSADEKKIIDKLSGEFTARLFGRAWDVRDRTGMAYMQAAGVTFTKADTKFVADVKTRTAPVEAKWVTDAQAKGLADPKKVLADFRAEIAKADK
jgi:TRAP-type transport system periplasmic protein